MTTSETPAAPRNTEKQLVLPFFRVILTRLATHAEWDVVSNPRWDYFSRAESAVLDNSANEYVEHANCGCVYRMIRAADWAKYASGDMAAAWTLDPRQNGGLDRHPGGGRGESHG